MKFLVREISDVESPKIEVDLCGVALVAEARDQWRAGVGVLVAAIAGNGIMNFVGWLDEMVPIDEEARAWVAEQMIAGLSQ